MGSSWGTRGCRGAQFPRGSMRSAGQIGSGGHLHAPPLSNFPKGEKSFFTNPLLANGVKHTSLLPGHLSRSLCLPTCHAFSIVSLFPPPPSLGGGEWFPSAAWTVTGAPLLAPRWLSVGCPLLGGCRILGPPPWRFWEPPALRPEVGLCLITAAKWLISSQWPIWRFNSSRSCFG